jgi:serine/threonine-protein kinase
MGSVYKGVHARSGEVVAIKVIATGVANQPRFRRRFETEAKTLQRLKHPNIVSVRGVGEEQGLLFYTMEYVDGKSLHEHLRAHRRLPFLDVIEVGIQTAGALKHAHDLGIIHRDLKPANLMVDKGGTIKLTDFGIAKLFGSGDMTAVGAVIGTADYMPPEQAEGKPVTTKSDLYSLGAVLYALLCGKAPFTGKSVPEVLYSVRYNAVPRLEERVEDVPIELCELIHHLLEKEPSRRPPTALVVCNRLKALQQGFRSRTSTTRPSTSTSADEQLARELTSLDLSDVDDDELRLTDEQPPGTGHRSVDSLPLDVLGTHEQETALAAEESLTPENQPADNQPAVNKSAKSKSAKSKSAKSKSAKSKSAKSKSAIQQAEGVRSGLAEEDSSASFEAQQGYVPIPGRTHYTPISNSASPEFALEDGPEESHSEAWLPYVSIAGMVVILLAAIGFLWWKLQPDSADALYAVVMTAAESGDESELFSVKGEIDEFLARFPDDQRFGELETLSRDMELTRWTNKLRRVATRQGMQEMTAVEQAFLDCMQARTQDWRLARVKLAAFTDIFGSVEDLSRNEQKLVELAEHALSTSDRQLKADESPAVLQLEAIIRSAESTLTDRQLKMFYQDLLLLYEGMPWATEQLGRIREKLTEL